MTGPTEAYVLGVLGDVDVEIEEQRRRLELARQRSRAVDAELSRLLRRLQDERSSMERIRQEAQRLHQSLAEGNLRIASLHQEMASHRRRADDLKLEMERVGPGAIQRRLRRERAKHLVQVEDREVQIVKLRERGDQLREAIRATEQRATESKDRLRQMLEELDRMQASLPPPDLYVRLAELELGHAHAHLWLGGELETWRSGLERAVQTVEELHRDLDAGKYRLDRNSDLLGGRTWVSGEALCAALWVGGTERASRLFELVADPELFFHEILNVFRLWVVGLLVGGRHAELMELIEHHRYDTGLREGYVEAVVGLLGRDARAFGRGLRLIAREEWAATQGAHRVRAAGLVSLGALTLARFGLERGLAVPRGLATVPERLLRAVERGSRGGRTLAPPGK